jgi:hypothetical protein
METAGTTVDSQLGINMEAQETIFRLSTARENIIFAIL